MLQFRAVLADNRGFWTTVPLNIERDVINCPIVLAVTEFNKDIIINPLNFWRYLRYNCSPWLRVIETKTFNYSRDDIIIAQLYTKIYIIIWIQCRSTKNILARTYPFSLSLTQHISLTLSLSLSLSLSLCLYISLLLSLMFFNAVTVRERRFRSTYNELGGFYI